MKIVLQTPIYILVLCPKDYSLPCFIHFIFVFRVLCLCKIKWLPMITETYSDHYGDYYLLTEVRYLHTDYINQ